MKLILKNSKGKRFITACTILIITIAVSIVYDVYLLMQNSSLQIQINTLQIQVSNLETEKDNLNSIIKSLESQRTELWNEINSLKNEVCSLEEAKKDLETRVSDLQTENEFLRSQAEPLMEIVNMKKSEVLINETLIFLPSSQKTWGIFYVRYCGLLLVRVQMIPEPGFADVPSVQIGVDLSSKLYITRSGTLNLTPGTGEHYYTSTALFPVADLEFPISFQVTVKNNSPYTAKLLVTITYVY